MLPTMQPIETSRTKRARATKSFEQVRVGPVRLYFSHFELIRFQLDGALPVVCVPIRPVGIGTGGHVEQHRLHLEPDRTKWLSKHEFEQKWHQISSAVFQRH
jgi:hypothetical protein